jgi:TolB-like protein/DNA-binding winged helix-turn-helix (wHTH) protein
VPLQEQPLQLLTALVEQPGEIVSRQELRRRLWADGTFVDYEAALNTAVRKVREALGDSPSAPRYVETVARHGYRFIAPVDRDGAALPTAPAVTGPALSEAAAEPSSPPRPARRRSAPARALVLTVAAIGLVGAALQWRRAHAPAPPILSLAVLPLDDLSPGPRSEFFAAGLTDELTTAIARQRVVRVTSRTSAEHFHDKTATVRDIGRRLGVDAVVEGSVRRADGRVRVTAQLIDARTDSHLWADSFEGEARDVLALQARVAEAVAERVGARLSRAVAGVATPRPIDPRAQEAYFRGRALFMRRTGDSLRQALAAWQEAVRIDPLYAAAHADIALCWLTLPFYTDLSVAEALVHGTPEARLAVRLDPDSAEAHVAMGLAAEKDRRFRAALREYERAIDLNPSHAPAHSFLGVLLVEMGRYAEGLRELTEARVLDPVSSSPRWQHGWALMVAGQHAAAVDELVALERDEPGSSPRLYHILGQALHEVGREAEAAAAFRRSLAQEEQAAERDDLRGHLLVLARDQRAWDEHVEAWERLPAGQRMSTTQLAAKYCSLGRCEEALRWLERAHRENDPDQWLLLSSPELAPLRNDPRLVTLARSFWDR